MTAKNRVIQFIPVWQKKQNLSDMPAYSIPYAEAKEIVLQGMAKWVNRCRGIKLSYQAVSLEIRGESCHPGLRTMDRFVQGNPNAAAIIAAWRPQVRFASL